MTTELSTKQGALRVRSDGVVQVLRSDGSPAEAGDGVGADLVELVLSSGPDGVPGSFRGRERALGVDMTNWSVVVDEAWIVKVPVIWGGSERSVRQHARLATAGLDLTPRLVGRHEWSAPGRGRATAALVTELMPSASDGWSWAVDDVVTWLTAGAGAPPPSWPEALGAMTARMHRALSAAPSDSGVESEPSTHPSSSARGGLRSRIHARLDDAVGAVDGEVRTRLRNRLGTMRALIDAAPDAPAAPVFPIHGDLHVGQFLRSAAADGTPRYAVVDFDGDPQHPEAPGGKEMVEVAAVDLAHLLVSVDLVGSIVQKRLGRRDERVLDWAAGARADLHEAYRAALDDLGAGSLLDDRVLPALEVEQFARELTYARRFLPRWQYAPDGALAARYAPEPGHDEETQWTPPAFETT